MTFLLGSDEEKGVFTPEIPNVKRAIERKFSKSRLTVGAKYRLQHEKR